MNFSSQPYPRISLADFRKHTKALQTQLKKIPVSLSFLHGSLAQDALKPLSDIDVAVLFKNDNYTLKTISAVSDCFCKILQREDIDIAVLNRASPLLCMQVLKKGQILYCKNKESLVQFRKKTFARYLATNHLRKQFYNYQTKAVLGDL